MSLARRWNKGFSMPDGGAFFGRLSNHIGRRLALRHKKVSAPKSCRISPDAWIHPRAGEIRLGERVLIAPGAMVQGNVQIGDDSSVQAYCNLVGYEGGEIQIGRYVRIGSHTVMVAANHRFERTDIPIAKQGVKPEPIVIEDDVWIGSRVNLLAGVRIGKGSVIGAGAVVTKDIPPYSVAVGVPARVIATRVGNQE